MFDVEALTSLPDRPLPEAALFKLEQNEKIEAITPMAVGDSGEQSYVLAFIVTVAGITCALAFDDDKGEWVTVKKTESVEDAFLYLQVWMENRAGRFD